MRTQGRRRLVRQFGLTVAAATAVAALASAVSTWSIIGPVGYDPATALWIAPVAEAVGARTSSPNLARTLGTLPPDNVRSAIPPHSSLAPPGTERATLAADSVPSNNSGQGSVDHSGQSSRRSSFEPDAKTTRVEDSGSDQPSEGSGQGSGGSDTGSDNAGKGKGSDSGSETGSGNAGKAKGSDRGSVGSGTGSGNAGKGKAGEGSDRGSDGSGTGSGNAGGRNGSDRGSGGSGGSGTGSGNAGERNGSDRGSGGSGTGSGNAGERNGSDRGSGGSGIGSGNAGERTDRIAAWALTPLVSQTRLPSVLGRLS